MSPTHLAGGIRSCLIGYIHLFIGVFAVRGDHGKRLPKDFLRVLSEQSGVLRYECADLGHILLGGGTDADLGGEHDLGTVAS